MVVTSFPLLGQSESGSDFPTFKRKLHHEEKLEPFFSFVITIRRVSTFDTYKTPITDIYTLKLYFIHARALASTPVITSA